MILNSKITNYKPKGFVTTYFGFNFLLTLIFDNSDFNPSVLFSGSFCFIVRYGFGITFSCG